MNNTHQKWIKFNKVRKPLTVNDMLKALNNITSKVQIVEDS